YLNEANVVQPDMFWISDENDRCYLVDGKYWRGAPDLVIEILSPGTTRRDRDVKYALYEQHGVREYWLVDAEERYIDVYRLDDGGQFTRQGVYGGGDTFASPLFPGVTLDATALLNG